MVRTSNIHFILGISSFPKKWIEQARMNFEYGAKLYKNLSTILRITFALLLTPDIPLVVLQLLRALLALCEVVMPVIAVVLLVAVTHTTVTPWLTHLLWCGLVTCGEARAHQGSFPPARSLVLKYWLALKIGTELKRRSSLKTFRFWNIDWL